MQYQCQVREGVKGYRCRLYRRAAAPLVANADELCALVQIYILKFGFRQLQRYAPLQKKSHATPSQLLGLRHFLHICICRGGRNSIYVQPEWSVYMQACIHVCRSRRRRRRLRGL